MRTGCVALAILVLTLVAYVASQPSSELSERYYRESCPRFQKIVEKAVKRAVKDDKRIAAGLLRMFFHDCFVRGCDASILLESDPPGDAEKDDSNNISLIGFELIDAMKAQLEQECPGTVSCADVIALACAEAVEEVGGPKMRFAYGRRDGNDSFALDAAVLPSFTDIRNVLSTFENVGLDVTDVVALSGAHTIGRSRCASLEGRLPPNPPDATLDRGLTTRLSRQCGNPINPEQLVNMDTTTPDKFDNQYYKNVLANRGVFVTDSRLRDFPEMSALVRRFAKDEKAFFKSFRESMVKMSLIDVLTFPSGVIRTNCRRRNDE